MDVWKLLEIGAIYILTAALWQVDIQLNLVIRYLIGQCFEKDFCTIIDRIKADNIKNLVNNHII